MPFPALLAALGRFAGSAIARSMAARAGAGAAEGAAAKGAQAAGRVGKVEKATDAFNRLFKDHPANQPPPLPDRRPWWQKAKDMGSQFFKGALDKWKENPITQATDTMSGMAKSVDSGKSIGQGMIDALKKVDPTGLFGLASAGMDLAGAAGARTVNVGRKVVQDDFVGLMGEVLPDAAMKFITALKDLTNAIVERGRYLAKYDPNLAAASATADVRRIQSEIKEAQTAGKSYSRVIDQQSQLENKLRDAFAPVKDMIADRLATILEILNRLIDASFIKEALAVFAEVNKVITAVLSMDPERIMDAILNMPERIAKALFGGDDGPPDMNDVIQNALADLKKQPGVPLADPKDRKGGNRFNFPIVKGA